MLNVNRIDFTGQPIYIGRFMSTILCKKERGYLLAFRIQVKENSIENPFHTLFITKDTHESSPAHVRC